MAGSAVAQNYAEALFDLASTSGKLEDYGRLLDATASALAASPGVQAALVSPNITKAVKSDVVGRTLTAVGAPREFVLFVQAVIKRGRQGSLSGIAGAYNDLVDARLQRVRAQITLARQPDQALENTITASLGKLLGKQVVAQFGVEPEILGGTIVRVGDRVYDGSLRRRLVRLKRQLLAQ